ncbi:hypothetical protein FKM82_029372, partial [Ascaphus truei]
GKDNVIVVVDDLEDSSSEEKRRILQNQPSIGRLAQDLILFTKEETDPAYKKPITAQDPEDERSLTGKLEKMTELLKDGKQRLVEEAAKKKREEKAENKEQLNTAGQGE